MTHTLHVTPDALVAPPAAGSVGNARQWMIDVNAREQKFVDLLISLASGALILPPLLLQTYLGIRDEPLAIFLDGKVYGSWGCLFLSIVLGVAFHYLSSKWVRLAWGQTVAIGEKRLQLLMDSIFWVQAALFLTGLAFFVFYVRTV